MAIRSATAARVALFAHRRVVAVDPRIWTAADVDAHIGEAEVAAFDRQALEIRAAEPFAVGARGAKMAIHIFH